MRYKLIFLFALLTAESVRAQFTFLSDSRSVSVYGSSGSQSYSQTNTPSAAFTDFDGSASGNANDSFTSSSAGQTSSEMANEISFAGSVSGSAPFGVAYSSGMNGYSGASSVFDVSFSVSTQTVFSLTENDYNEQGFPGGSFTLSSANDGLILQGPPANNYGFPAVNEYSGVLDPDDVYTLQIVSSLQVFASPSQMNAQDAAGITVVMAAPEPSSTLLLGAGAVALGLLAMLRHRKNSRKMPSRG